MSILSNLFQTNIGRDNIETINGTNYIYNVHLFNGTSKVGIKFAATDNLTIIDDLRYFYSYGTMTFNYNNDILEAFEGIGEQGPTGSTSQFKPYVFRGDGRDLLLVEIMPQLKDTECLEFSPSEGEKEKYMIKHTFSVYHFEDITDSMGMKRRTLYFWDRDFQLLNNINVDFSTRDLKKTGNADQDIININDAQVDVKQSTTNTGVYTGEAVKGLLDLALKQEYKISVKYGRWDKGATTINYTSPSQFKAIDDLDYLISYHVSTDENDNLPSLLKKQRYTEKYQLIPLNKFFTENLFSGSSILNSLFGGMKQTEDFYIGKLNTGETDLFGASNSILGGTGKSNVSDYNLIDNYNFTKINANELQKYFNTYAVHTNDPRGYFNADLQNNSYKKIKDMYKKVFVDNMGGRGGGAFSNAPDNTVREESKNAQHVFVPYSLEEKQRKSFGINRSMLNLFFKNTSIQFNVRGNTIRQTGNFFTVNRRDSATMKTHDSNVLGQYITTYLRHEFKTGTYTNTILGMRPYSVEDNKFAKPL
jgi:hypothetical protein